jgi:hypothetical protein
MDVTVVEIKADFDPYGGGTLKYLLPSDCQFLGHLRLRKFIHLLQNQ